jgi:hypothetical protein
MNWKVSEKEKAAHGPLSRGNGRREDEERTCQISIPVILVVGSF